MNCFGRRRGLRSFIRVCWVPFILLVRIGSGSGFGNGSALHWEESRFGPIPVDFSPDLVLLVNLGSMLVYIRKVVNFYRGLLGVGLSIICLDLEFLIQ